MEAQASAGGNPRMAYLPESIRMLILEDDGSVHVHADAGGYKPLD